MLNTGPHSLLYTMRHQNNLSDEHKRHMARPMLKCPSAPWWYSWNMQRVWQQLHLWLTCACPCPWDIPHLSRPPIPILPTHTYMHRSPTPPRGQGRGFSLGWGARRRLCALIFTSPTMTLCNWWHKWPPAARLSCFSPLPSAPVFLLAPQFFCHLQRLFTLHSYRWNKREDTTSLHSR